MITLAALVREHQRTIRAALLRRGVPRLDVDDVAQEVLVGAVQGLPSFAVPCGADAGGALRAWLLGICAHQASAHRRRLARRAEELVEPKAFERLEQLPDGDPEARYFSAEARVIVARLVERLRPDRRAVLVGHELEGLPMAEIAAAVGACANTCWGRLRAARQDLRVEWRRR